MEQTLIYTHADGRVECHPLFNQTVLEALVRFLSVRDLTEVRLVCERWRAFADPALQLRAWVNMGIYKHNFLSFLEFVREQRSWEEKMKGDDCSDNRQRRRVLQYQNFKFSSSCWMWNVENLDRFISMFGSTLRSLKLVHVVIPAYKLRRILRAAPQLQELTFESSYFHERDDGSGGDLVVELPPYSGSSSSRLKSFTYTKADEDSELTDNILLPFTWDELFTSFPSLTELNVLDLSEEKRLIFMRSVLAHRSRLQITKLNIFGQTDYSARVIEDHEWTLLHSLNLRLDSLQIDVGQALNEFQIQKLLSQQAPSLRSLRIWRGSLAPDADGFPYGVSLAQVELMELPFNLVKSVAFLSFFPKLHTLWLRICDTDPYEDLTTIFDEVANVNVQPHESMRTLRVDARLTPADLEIIARILPKLSSLNYFELK